MSNSGTLLEFIKLLNSSLNLEDLLKHLLRSVLGYLLVSKGVIAIQIEEGKYSINLLRGLKDLKVGDLLEKETLYKQGINKIYPIGNQDSPVGYLGISKPLKGEITSQNEEMILALLSVASGNINNALAHKHVQSLNQELKQKNQELRAVLEFSQELSSSIDPETIITLLGLTLSGHWAVKKYAVVTWKEPYSAISRQKGINIKNINILKQNLANLPKAIFVVDLPDSELKNTLLEQGANLLFPIAIYGSKTKESKDSLSVEVFGAMILGSRLKKSYSHTEIEFGASLVAQACVALQQAWYVKEMVDRRESAAKELGQKQADKMFSALVDVLPGTILDDKYRLENKIGSGGFGAIYKATHLSLNNSVAIKVLRPKAGNKNLEQLARFHQEAITACKLNHPNAVKIFDCSISKQGMAYIVMELLSGYSLSDFLKSRGTLSFSECASIIYPVCNVLAHAHSMSLVHRDIKPENIFLHKTPKGEIVKIVDFGLAKIYSDNTDEVRNITQHGELIGTPAYISPERVRGEKCDGKTDIYSLGIVLYEVLTGKLPFDFRENTFFSMAMSHINDTPTPIRKFNPNLPTEVEEIVMRTLSKNPSERPTAKELAKFFLKSNTTANLSIDAFDNFIDKDHPLTHQEGLKETSNNRNLTNIEREKATENNPYQATVKFALSDDASNETKIDENIISTLQKIKNKMTKE